MFAAGDRVDITGISKGKGYQGVIKRHGAHRLKETHGTGPVHRHAGSMGSSTDPSRIFKGKIGAGQMGNEQVTVMNLDVIQVDEELGVIAVRGAIPGPKGGVVHPAQQRQEGPGEEDRRGWPASTRRRLPPVSILRRPLRVTSKKGENDKCLKRTFMNMAGKQVGEVELSEAIFGIEPNQYRGPRCG